MIRIAIDDLAGVARSAARLSDSSPRESDADHPFELRRIGGVFPSKVKQLFDDAHYSDASFTALKYLDKYVQKHSGTVRIGKDLMMQAFSEKSPLIAIANLETETGRNQQEGFKFLAAGVVLFVRNPRGHEVDVVDSADDCLDYLSTVAMLIKEMVKAGYR